MTADRGPWLAARAAPAWPGPQTLPATTDVVVIGAGLAGALVALELARSGARCTLVEARDDVGAGATGRDLGLAIEGHPDAPSRLIEALGAARAAELHAFGRRGVDALAGLDLLDRTGVVLAATASNDAAEVRASAACADRLGMRANPVPGAAAGLEGLDPCLLVPSDGLVDPGRAVPAIAQAARRTGAAVHCGCPVRAIEQEPACVAVLVGEHRVRCDAVVFAAGPGLPSVDPFFEDKITPVREHALFVHAAHTGALPLAGRARHGHLRWRHTARGTLLAGCRWATPHLEVGETDDSRTSHAVQARLDAALRTHLPGLAEATVRHRWSWIVGHTCDGLPIVGPIPGAQHLVCCAGFQGQPWALGAAAARAVSVGLLTGRNEAPPWLSPARFV